MKNNIQKIILGIILLSLSYFSYAQQLSNGCKIIEKEKKFGITNSLGEEILPIMFDGVYPMKFFENRVIAKSDGNMYMIFDYVKQSSIGSRYGVEEALNPFKIEGGISKVSENDVIMISFMNKKGFINGSGQIVLSLTENPIMASSEGNGYLICRDDTFALLNTKATRLTPYKYTDFLGEWNKYWLLYAYNRWTFVDTTGNERFEIETVKDVKVFEYKGFAGMINNKGAVIIPFEYENIEIVEPLNAAVVQKDGMFSVLNMNGIAISQTQYSKVVATATNFKIELNDKKGILTLEGVETWEP